MTLYRVIHNKDNPYLTINTSITEDSRLSWKAKGVWFYAFSRSDDWVFYFNDLLSRSTEGRDSLRKTLKELEFHGYLYRQTKFTENRNLDGQEWFFFETPHSKEEIKILLRKTGNPSDGNPARREPRPTEKRPLPINKDTVSKKEKENINRSSADASDVNNFLHSFLKELNEKFIIKRKVAWEKNMQKLLKQYSKDEIKEVINWIFTADHVKAEFWRTIIQSPDSLYNSIDQIVVQMKYKSKKETVKDQEKKKNDLTEKNRDWAQDFLSKFSFNHDRYIKIQSTCVEIKNNNEFTPIGFDQPNFQEIIVDKLKKWELL